MKKTLIATSTILILTAVAFFAWAADDKSKSEDFDKMMSDSLLELKVKATFLEKLGWVWEVNVPTERALEAQRRQQHPIAESSKESPTEAAA